MYNSSFRLTNRDIDLAFEAGHLFIVCQPKLSLVHGEPLGAEAYVRWNHPDYGLLPPGLFLSFFERRERSGELTRLVARAAADAISHWRAAGQDWPLSINLGAADLADTSLPGALDEIMGERGLDPASLILEVPEGAFARHGDAAAHVLMALRRLGFGTALDGGGAVIVPDDVVRPEYFDEVKIGGAAIIQFASRLKQSGLGFVGKRVALAASRGLGATAVGVEDGTTLAALPSLGFTAAQGALIRRPSTPADLLGWTAPDLLQFVRTPEQEDDTGEVLLLTDPLPDIWKEFEEETSTDKPAAEATPLPPAPIIEYSWEDAKVAIPGEEVRGVAWRLDRVCLFPDRHLVALIRRPRRLPHMARREKPVSPKAVLPKPRPRPPIRKRKSRSPVALVTRPSLLHLALGF